MKMFELNLILTSERDGELTLHSVPPAAYGYYSAGFCEGGRASQCAADRARCSHRLVSLISDLQHPAATAVHRVCAA
jgi:hypothetical protein